MPYEFDDLFVYERSSPEENSSQSTNFDRSTTGWTVSETCYCTRHLFIILTNFCRVTLSSRLSSIRMTLISKS